MIDALKYPIIAGILDSDDYYTEVEVEMAGSSLPPGIPEGSYFSHGQKVKIKWQAWIEARDWGIKGISPVVPPDQEFELKFEEPTDDGDIEHPVKWKLKEVDIEFEPIEDSSLSLQILPTVLHIDFEEGGGILYFQIS
jgi:hypothetical protein